jgi:hypothetical protein
MPGRLRLLLDWLLFTAFGPTTVRGGIRDEQTASLALYSTSGRSVTAAPNNAPAALDTPGRMDHEEQAHGRIK